MSATLLRRPPKKASHNRRNSSQQQEEQLNEVHPNRLSTKKNHRVQLGCDNHYDIVSGCVGKL
jgi:hypothetical protein